MDLVGSNKGAGPIGKVRVLVVANQEEFNYSYDSSRGAAQLGLAPGAQIPIFGKHMKVKRTSFLVSKVATRI